MFAGSLAMAGIGLLTAASGSIKLLFIGYAGLFGVANGIGYGFALQLSARVFSHRSGFAMGITTAAYALGATVGAQILGKLVESHDSLSSLRLHGMSFLLLAPVLGLLIYFSKAKYRIENEDHKPPNIDRSLITRYRVSYGLAVFAGLMAIAHATPFISSQTNNGSLGIALWGAMILGIGNALGGVLAGMAADKYSLKVIITLLPTVAALALGVAAFSVNVNMALAALAVIGFTYGALIAVYPVAIARHFGQSASATAYGRVFITWGAAGLLAPVMAGVIFDFSQDYRYSMLIAMVMSLLSAFAAYRLQLN